jgi:glycerate 2-kinase
VVGSREGPLTVSLATLRADLGHIVAAAIAGADAGLLLNRALARGIFADTPALPTRVLAVGKAALPMARAFAAAVPGPGLHGLIVTPRIAEAAPPGFDAMLSAHPVPDERSVRAGRAALGAAHAIGSGERFVVLLSGGASALMTVPAPGVSLEAKREVTRRLLRADADIHAVNCVRKHLSDVKGGRLAAACAGRTVTLAISDVVGDDPSVIGSGPTVADPTTFLQALVVIDACGGRGVFPRNAIAWLERGAAGDVPETPKPGAASLTRSIVHIIGSGADARAAAVDAAQRLGYRVIGTDRPIVGEASVRGVEHASWLAALARDHSDALCLVSGGETTVRVRGSGTGGRNQEFALAAVPGLATIGRAAALASVGTDGIDGPTDAAGAIADSSSATRARASGADPMRYLEANDAWSFFQRLGDLVRTGATDTNVGDVQVALIGAADD